MVAPAPAHAQTTVVIRGGGWGHGIGMSQYGAYGRALNGRSAPEILEHYYSGAQVQGAPMPRRIRVGLLQHRNSISASSQPPLGDSRGRVVFKVEGASGPLASGSTGSAWRVEASSTGGMRLYKNGQQVKRDGKRVFGDETHPLLLVFERYGSLVRVTEKSNNYAFGRMEFGVFSSNSCDPGYCLRLVLNIGMQKYLYGLGEVPSSWPGAVLRSQAIAGRTYAYEKTLRLGQHRYPCDCAVYDSTIDQAYDGDGKRVNSGEWWDDWKAAVDDTKGQVILHGAAPIQALYSSSSGGHTENNENVWGGTPLPYLRGVSDKPDAVDANPNHKWEVSMTWSQFESRLQNAFGMGSLKDFGVVAPRGVSGRVTVYDETDNSGGARIVGSSKTVRADGWDVRNALGLKDTLFRVEVQHAVAPLFEKRWSRLNGAPGEPLGAAYGVPKRSKKTLGRSQDFVNGRMTWRKKTGKVVWQRGVILEAYNDMGRERGPLGLPTSDVWGEPGKFRGGTYVNGTIYSSDVTGIHSVRGPMRVAYRKVDAVEGPLRLPTSDRQSGANLPNKGKRQRFQRGTIYLNPNVGKAFALWAEIEKRYRSMGEASSRCGYPTSHVVVDQFGKRATFQRGIISWTDLGGVEVECEA